jgi:hypothetical protein
MDIGVRMTDVEIPAPFEGDVEPIVADHKLFEAPLLRDATADREVTLANLPISHSEGQESGVYLKLIGKKRDRGGQGLARPVRARRHGRACTQ